MSDDSKPAAPKEISPPLTSWVKGGTHTSIHEQTIAKKRADAEQRRQAEAARQKTVAQDPTGAHQSTMKLGGSKSHAAIVLEIQNSDRKAEEWIVCELIAGAGSDPTELILNMCCPFCARRHGMDEAQLKFSNKHRKFELDIRRQGELWVNPKDPREFVTLAGTIHLTEAVSCPTCQWRFRIDNSVVRTV